MKTTKPAPSQPTQKPDEHQPLIDTSKMSAGQRAALELTEAARDAASEKGSFAEGLFMGKLDLGRLLPFPEQSAEDRDQGDAFLQQLEKFLREQVDPDEIDRTDILRATLVAMRRAVEALRVRPDFVLVDALTIPGIATPQRGIVHGDRLSASIAAASIVAKFYRDEMMRFFHGLYPAYGFDRHKGYGTRDHFDALARYGPTPLHRSTFRGVRPEVAPVAPLFSTPGRVP